MTVGAARMAREAPARRSALTVAYRNPVVSSGLQMAPFVGLLFFAVVVPIFFIVRYAFADMGDWAQFFDNSGQVEAVVHSIVISGETTGICIVLGYIYAGALVRAAPLWRAVLMVAFILPFLSSILARTYGWLVLLSDVGPVVHAIHAITGASPSLLYNRVGVLIGMTSIMLPFFALPLYSVWRQVPDSLRKAARTLGANPIETFVHVDLPLSLPGAAAGALLVFIASVGFFVTPSLLGGQGDTMVSQVINEQLTVAVNVNQAAVLAVVTLGAVFVAILIFRVFYPIEVLFVQDARNAERKTAAGAWLGHRWAQMRRWRGGSGRARAPRTGPMAQGLSRLPYKLLANVVAGFTAVGMAAPLAVVIPVSLTNQSYIQFPPSSYSFRWFRSVLADPSWRAAAAHSLVASGVAVAIVFGVGMPAAFWIARSKLSARTRGAFMLAATIPVVLPLIVLALGVYIWYLEIHTVGSLLFLGIAQATLGLPFLVISVTVALRNFDVRLERASRSLGASGLTTMRLVTLPLIAAAVLSGLILAFFQAFDELLMALNVTNSTSMTLPVKMWIGATQELSPALATVSVLLLLATAVGFVCAVLPLRISQRRRARLGREV